MKIKTTALLVIVSALLFSACRYISQQNTSTIAPITPSATITSTPTPSRSLNELNLELDSTIDDGGQADLNQLQKDSAGF